MSSEPTGARFGRRLLDRGVDPNAVQLQPLRWSARQTYAAPGLSGRGLAALHVAAAAAGDHADAVALLAVDETVILLHPPLPLAGVSMVMERERQQNDSLVNG